MLPTSFHDVTALREVSLGTWKSIFTAAGDTSRLQAASTYELLWESLTTNSPGQVLFNAIEVLLELGTDDGRDLILNAADDRQVPLGAVDDEPARELAARVWLESRSNAALAEVLVRAQVSALEARHVRTYRECVGKRALSAKPLDRERLLAAVENWCRKHKKSDAIQVYIYESAGEWRCEIMRGEALKRVIEIKDKRPEILNFRPAVADHLRYDAETGRLGIATRSPRLLQMYREVLGTLLADDAAHFSNENICTLKPLQEQGRALFDRHRVPGILRVDVVELRWRRGDRDKVWVKGPDCFRILEDVGARLIEGRVIEARLSIWFAGCGRAAHVTIRVPGQIDINAGANEYLVEQLLDEVGIRGAFDSADERLDLWSLYPWRMNEETWRRHVGTSEFDRLVQQRVLHPVSLEATTHPDHPAAPNALDVETIAGTTMGISDDPAIPLRTLTSSDVMGYQLDTSCVAREISSALGLEGSSSEIPGGIWALGRRSLSPTIAISVFLASRRPGPTTGHSIRATANGSRPVLLVPVTRTSETDVPQIECRVPSGPYGGLIGRIVERLNLQDQVDPPMWLSEDLILVPKKGTAWYRKVLLSKLLPGTHPYKFAEKVVAAEGQLVTKETLREYLSSMNPDDSVVRKAKSDFVQRVRESFEEAGLECPPEVKQVFASRSGGYVLKATARVLS
jgi:hypothetical protein